MTFQATDTCTSTSALESVVGVLKKQVHLEEQDVSSTACCSESESTDCDILVESESVKFSVAKAEPPAQTLKKRRARFALAKTQVIYVPMLDEISKLEHDECWWNPKDMQAFRFSAKHSSHEAKLEGRGAAQAVNDGYKTAAHLACSLQEHEMEQALAEHKVVELTAGLKIWACRPFTCRGLEHWTSKKFFEDRLAAMDESHNLVLHTANSPDEISKQYQDSTRAARILARLRGHADYEAAVAVVLNEKELAAAAEHLVY
jgi:hypothetical protein